MAPPAASPNMSKHGVLTSRRVSDVGCRPGALPGRQFLTDGGRAPCGIRIASEIGAARASWRAVRSWRSRPAN
jgi:hypothetical protein